MSYILCSGRSVLQYHPFVAASLFVLSRELEPVVDMPLQCVDPGDQRIEFPGVDFVLKPRDLITHIAQVVKDFFRTCLGLSNRMCDGVECMKRPMRQLADLSA